MHLWQDLKEERMMDKGLLHILRHSVGLDDHGKGNQYRNHYAASPGSESFAKCNELVEMGYMRDMGPAGSLRCFVVTQLGMDKIK